VDQPVDVLIADRLVARGEIVSVGDRFGVRLTEVLPAAAA
jgi:flagellar motor switch protein FliN/FliY